MLLENLHVQISKKQTHLLYITVTIVSLGTIDRLLLLLNYYHYYYYYYYYYYNVLILSGFTVKERVFFSEVLTLEYLN
jgi:hypothetical protein